MEYEIIFVDFKRKSSDAIKAYTANWTSEVNAIVNTGLEEGYEVWVRKVNYERRLDKDMQINT